MITRRVPRSSGERSRDEFLEVLDEGTGGGEVTIGENHNFVVGDGVGDDSADSHHVAPASNNALEQTLLWESEGVVEDVDQIHKLLIAFDG